MNSLFYMIPHLNKGGAEDVVVNLVNGMVKEGNKVSLLVFTRGSDDGYNLSRVDSKVNVIFLFKKKFVFQSFKERLYNKMLYLLMPIFAMHIYFKHRVYEFNVVHANLTLASFYLPFLKLLSKLCRKKTIFVETFHTNWHLLKAFNKVIFSFSWSFSDVVVYEIGSEEDKYILKCSLCKNVQKIPFAVPVAEESEHGFLNEFSSQFNISKRQFNIVTISRLRIFEKRFDIMLRALKLAKDKGLSDFKFIICGDGPDRAIIHNLISELNLDEQVVITGYVDKPQQIVKLADVFLVAMAENSTGIAGLQAAVAGIPCVGVQTASNYSSNADVIFSSSEPQIIANKIIELVSKDNREKYGNECYEYVSSKFSLSRFVNDYNKLYQSLIS